MSTVLRCKLRIEAFFWVFLLIGCQTISRTTVSNGLEVSPEAAERVKTERLGDYFVGRRLVGQHFYFWGYVKKPGESWDRAKLVMLNENMARAPDRVRNASASDTHWDNRRCGIFSADRSSE